MESVHHLHKLSFKGKSIRQAFCGYFNADLFTDCTLIGACGNFLRVHRSILSPVSDYFATLFMHQRSEVNLVIALPNIEFKDLKRIVEFMYIGEVILEEVDLDGFMLAVDLLQIKGVTPQTPLTISGSSKGNSSARNLTSSNSSSCSKSSSDSPNSIDEESDFEIVVKKRQRHKSKKNCQQVKKLKVATKADEHSDNDRDTKAKENIQCEFCHKRFCHGRKISQHQRECRLNPNRRIFQCSDCPRTFTRNCRLNEHYKKVHNAVDSSIIIVQNPPIDSGGDKTQLLRKNSV